jgi:hypothetical protein
MAFDYFLNKESIQAYDYFINIISLSDKEKVDFLQTFLINKENSIKIIKFLKNQKEIFNDWKNDIIKGLLSGLDDKQIKLLLTKNLDSSIKAAIRKQIIKHKDLSADQLYIFMQYRFDEKFINKDTLKNIHIVNKDGQKILVCKDKKTKNKLPDNIKDKLQIDKIIVNKETIEKNVDIYK